MTGYIRSMLVFSNDGTGVLSYSLEMFVNYFTNSNTPSNPLGVTFDFCPWAVCHKVEGSLEE